MIIIYSPTTKCRMAIDGVVRNGSSLWYLIGIGMGFSTCCLLINAEDESDAMDVYADSRYGHLTAIDSKDMDDYLVPERKKAIDLMEQIETAACDAMYQLEHESDYTDNQLDHSANDILDWANELGKIDWKNDGDLYENLNYLGNCGDPHQLDELRIFECIPKSQIDWFHKKTDLSFDPNRNQQF